MCFGPRSALDRPCHGGESCAVKSGEAHSPHGGKKLKAPDADRLRADLDAYMARHGLRSTEQRRVIIDTFFGTTEHITIDTLLREVRAVDARVGYATVYRTMKLLTESGVVQEHKFGDGFTRYELADDDAHHDHLICLECGKITEFEEDAIEELQAKIAKRHGFLVRAHKHEMYGICSDCQAKTRPGRR
jgi:Fur family transcriptional regulator, ferric uptake regulator